MNDGGQAFPRAGYGVSFGDGIDAYGTSVDGMSLRDFYAAAAIQGIMANKDTGGGNRALIQSQMAFVIADAMLAEREKETE